MRPPLAKTSATRKRAINGFLVDSSSEILGGEDWALAGGGDWVKGKVSNGSNSSSSSSSGSSSSSTLGEELEKAELQRKQDRRESFPGTRYLV